MARISIFWSQPPPPRVRSNAAPHPHPHHFHTTPVPPPIALHCRLPWHTQNRATMLGFRVFRPQPPPLVRICERATPPSKPHHSHLPRISPHYPALPWDTQNRATTFGFRVFR